MSTVAATNYTVQYHGYPSWLNQIVLIIIVAILTPFTAGIALLIGVPIILYRHFSVQYNIQGVGGDAEIEAREGIIARNTQSIRAADLRNINIKQSVIQRLVGIGTVEFSTAGGSGIEVRFAGIPKPQELKAKVQMLQRGR